jgi:hypothetical protein
VRLIRAALVHGVARVDLPETHLDAGAHILQVRVRGRAAVVLSAELAGETATGSFALRLMPLDPSHIPELTAITEGDEEDIPPSRGPMSALAARPMMKTIPDPEPEDVDEDELDASVLFDPVAALISRAPARPEGTEPVDDDAETFPRSSGRHPAAPSEGTLSSEAGPRTMRRNTGAHGIVIVGRRESEDAAP